MGRKVIVAWGVTVASMFLFSSLLITQEPQAALTEREVIELVKQGNLKDVATILERRDVGFDLNIKIEKKLRKAGADDEIIQDVWKAGPRGPGQPEGDSSHRRRRTVPGLSQGGHGVPDHAERARP